MTMQRMRWGDLGELFDGPHATPKRRDEGPYFLNISSLKSGRLDLSESDRVSEEDFEKWTRRVTPQEGDLLFSYETRLGEAALMPADLKACLGRRMALLRPDPRVIDSKYLLYFYLSPQFQRLIDARSIVGATVPRILLSTMPEWPIEVHPLREQQAIVEVLGVLDDNIAASNRIAGIADELVRIWWRQLVSQSSQTLSVGELCRQVRDQVQPPFSSGIFVGLEHLGRRFLWMNDRGDVDGVASAKSRFCEGDLLFGKLRPYFHKVVVADTEGVCSTDIMVLRTKKPALRGFLWAAASCDEIVDEVSRAAEGTRMPRANWADVAAFEVPWPGEDEAVAFSALVAALGDRVMSAMAESRTLAALRDILLPALMSGRLSVPQAEDMVSEVV